MNRAKTVRWLVVAVAAQLVVIAAMFVNANLPLLTGTKIQVETVPVDPRSLFRGNYALLSYPFSRPSAFWYQDLPTTREGEYIYVVLEPDEDNVYQMTALTLDKPKTGLFIRGRASRVVPSEIEFGIEAYFAPVEQALALEKTLASGAYATLYVASSGKAALSAITETPLTDAESEPH
uniref:GDYXXLXY domain-containing protein n=1 Tax=Thaumasiovibrio occultus TaxID=1891184 RepID=UPI000B35732B|nr:GDYXXLXY domain-containing protein [Thaumasiovibrio occultus]